MDDYALRLSVYQIPGFMEIKNKKTQHKTLGGSMGYYIMSFINTLFRGKNYTIVPTSNGEQLGDDIGNGTYNGAIGSLQRNESDIVYLPAGMFMPYEFLDISPIVCSISGKLLQQIDIVQNVIHILDTLYISETFTFLILASIVSLVVVVSVNGGTLNSAQYSCFELLRCLVNQINITQKLGWNLKLATTIILSVFGLLEIYESSIHCDLVTIDYSQIITSMSDVIRRKITPYLAKDDPFTKFIRYSSKLEERNLFLRADSENKVMRLDLALIPKNTTAGYFMGNQYICKALQRIICMKQPKAKEWNARFAFTEIPSGFYYRKDPVANRNTARKVIKRIGYVAVSGILSGLWNIAIEKGVNELGVFGVNCRVEKLSDLESELETGNFVPFQSFIGLMVVILCMIIFAIAVFTCEIALNVVRRID